MLFHTVFDVVIQGQDSDNDVFKSVVISNVCVGMFCFGVNFSV